jgi:hypothetical protein
MNKFGSAGCSLTGLIVPLWHQNAMRCKCPLEDDVAAKAQDFQT